MDLRELAKGAAASERARQRTQRLGVNPSGNKLWSDTELALVRLHGTDYKLLSKLLPNRSLRAIQAQCSLMHLTRPRHNFTTTELSRLRSMYQSASWGEILEAFPRHTKASLRVAAASRGWARPRIPFKLSGHPMTDEIIARCFEIGWNLSDLDDEAGTGKYFHKRYWRRRKRSSEIAVLKAAKALGGRIVIEWDD